MKVLMPTTEFPPQPGGVATLAFEQAEGLSLRGVRVRVDALDSGGEPPNFMRSEIRYQKLKSKAIWRLAPLTVKLWLSVLSFRPQVLYSPTYRGYGLPLWIVSKLTQVPFGLYLHGTELNTELKSPIRRIIMQGVLRGAAFVATNSTNTAMLTTTVFPELRGCISPILPGVHLPDIYPVDQSARSELRREWLSLIGRTPLENSPEPVILLAVCRMVEAKGIDTTLKALADLKHRRPDLNIVFVGVGGGDGLPRFVEMVHDLQIQDRVIFPGGLPYQRAQQAFTAADVYVQPSRPVGDFLESFGISFMEAQAHGLPCIGSRWGGVPEAVEEGVTALLVEPGDTNGLSHEVETLAQDRDLRVKMSSAARQRAEKMSWAEHCATLDSLIRRHDG